MAKLYLLAFAGLLLAAQLASAAEPTATDPAHKHPKPPSNHTADGKPVKPPGNHTYVPKPKPGKGTWNHTAPTKPTKPGSNHTEWPKASSPTKGSKDITNGPWSKPFKPSKGAKWDNKNSSSSNHSAGGAKPAGRRHGGHDGSSGNSGGKLLNGRKNFFLDPYTPLFTKVRGHVVSLTAGLTWAALTGWCDRCQHAVLQQSAIAAAALASTSA
jgi:hypothetical protein